MAAEEPRTVGDAPDLFVGIGPAAEVLGIPHVRLHAAIREGRLLTYAARRDGRMVRLLRLGDLILLDPALGDRPLPDSLLDGPADPSPDPTRRTERKRADGPAPDAAVAPGASASLPSVRARGPRRGRSDDPAGDESQRYLWGELERVRQQMRESREQQESVVQDLLRSGEEARQLFARLSLDEEARRSAQAELARERAEIDRALADLDRMRRFTFASVTIVVLLAAAAIGYVARSAPATSRAAESAVGREAGDEPGAALASRVQVTPDAPAEQEIIEQEVAGLPPVSAEPRVAEVAAPARAAPVPPAGEETRAGETALLEDTPEERPGMVELALEEEAVVRADEGEGLRALPGPPPAGAQRGDRACELFSVTRPGMPLREVLGPCWGRWNPDLAATVGSSRSGGEAYCRQHAFFERALGASLVRAEQEADLARRAGLVPPLLRMRIETAASAALAAHVPSWLESGFEAGSVEGHRVEAGGGPDESWIVDSWVRYVDFAANERRRTFRVEVLLGDGPEPDRERSFAWTDDDSPTDEDGTPR